MKRLVMPCHAMVRHRRRGAATKNGRKEAKAGVIQWKAVGKPLTQSVYNVQRSACLFVYDFVRFS